jgi:hypothetical protein
VKARKEGGSALCNRINEGFVGISSLGVGKQVSSTMRQEYAQNNATKKQEREIRGEIAHQPSNYSA